LTRSIVPAGEFPYRCSGLFAAALAVAAVQAGWAGPQADAGAVFGARKAELGAVGVHRAEGFVFSCYRMAIPRGTGERALSAAEGQAGARAIRQMLEWHVGERALAGMQSGPVRDALMVAGVSCFGESVNLAGMLTVQSETGPEAVTVVRAVPEDRLLALAIDRERLRACIASRAEAGKGRATDPLLVEELDGAADVAEPERRSRLLSALKATLGPGIDMSLSGRWADSSGALCAACLSGWTDAAAEAVSKTGACGGALSPLPASVVAGLTVEDLLQVAAVRINDPAVLRSLAERLASEGFAGSARLLRVSEAALVAFDDRPGDRLERSVRAKVFASPVVVALLLTDGKLDAAWGATPACLAPATAAFDEGTPESVARSISMLSEGMGVVPNADAVSLLAAALLASDEPRLAEPLARAAFTAMPSHKFAGVNALRAQRALDLRDRARELLPRVAAEAQLGNWGRRQLESVAEWLGVPAPPVAPPKGAAGEG
jgi:hypothetical protein